MHQTQYHDTIFKELPPPLPCSASAEPDDEPDDPLFDAIQVSTEAVAYEADMRALQVSDAAEESEAGDETAAELEEFEAIVREAAEVIANAIRLQEAVTAMQSAAGGEEEEPETAASPAADAAPEAAADEQDMPDTDEEEDFVTDANKPVRPAARGKSGPSRGGRKSG